MLQNRPTFEELPKLVFQLFAHLERIENRLIEIQNQRETPLPEKEILTLKEVCELLDRTPSTIYQLVNQRRIPHTKKAKRLYFSRREINKWISERERYTTPDKVS